MSEKFVLEAFRYIKLAFTTTAALSWRELIKSGYDKAMNIDKDSMQSKVFSALLFTLIAVLVVYWIDSYAPMFIVTS